MARHRRTSMFLCVWVAQWRCFVLCISLRLGCSVFLSCVACWINKHASNAPFRILMCLFLIDFCGFRVHFRSSWPPWAPLWTHPAPYLLTCRKLCEKGLQNGRLLGSIGPPMGSIGEPFVPKDAQLWAKVEI